jgi:hypothetical protein
MFYDGVTWILFSSCFSIIALFCVAAFLSKRKPHISTKSPIFVYGVLIFGFIIASVLFLSVGRRLQTTLAIPYIQESLDQKCGQGVFRAAEGDVYNESGFYWQANAKSAQCYYSSEGWICSCSTK